MVCLRAATWWKMVAFGVFVTLVGVFVFEIYGARQIKTDETLVLVHVLFRHGNRTAHGKSELYPKDPYYNKTYFPIGLGQLTRAGKLKEYNIGTQLRKRYSDFLGQDIYPQLVDARSTDYNRTKASLLLCLAGLFPPTTFDLIIDSLSWQAMPTNYWPINNDPVLAGYRCPNYIKMYDENKYKPSNQKLYDENAKIFQYISDNSGLNITSFEQIYHLYFGISTEVEFGLEQPQWIKNIWPHPIVDLSVKQYYVATDTVDMKRILSGYLLKKIIDDSESKIQEDPNEEFKTKMYLYSAHEDNIANFLITLKVFNDNIPNYGSYVIVELHKIENVFGLKLFRHGNRTAEPSELYPNDPYLNKTYFPIGLGQLTNAGKQREFNIGKALRDRYNNFLGPYVYPELVDASSTNYNRTKASLLYCLAGLFPPRGEQIWSRLDWQAVPYNSLPRNDDPVLLGTLCPKYTSDYEAQTHSDKQQIEYSKDKALMDYVSKHSGLNVTTFLDLYHLYFSASTEQEYGLKLPMKILFFVLLGTLCPKYTSDYEAQTHSDKQQIEYSKDKALMDYVSKHSGLNVTTFLDLYHLYFSASTEQEYGLKLPNWLQKVFQNITEAAIKEYYVATATTELRQMAAGYLIQKIISDTNDKIKEDPKTEFKKKAYLYSAHESNVAHFLITLDIFEPHVPTYGSYVTLEVHKIAGKYGIKVYYQNYSTNKPRLMKLPGCEEFCALDQFTELYSEYFPPAGLCGNKKC